MDQGSKESPKSLFLSPNTPAVSQVQGSSGNATGTNRTKVALKPGYSLVGWVRFCGDSKPEQLTGISKDQLPMRVSMEELKKHCTVDDCWIALNGNVYNVTKYIDYHPGGEDELMRGAGSDATKLFEEYHSFVNYHSLLEKCFIGHLMKRLT